MSEGTTKTTTRSGRLLFLEFPLEIRVRIFELFFVTARRTERPRLGPEQGDESLRLPLKGPFNIRMGSSDYDIKAHNKWEPRPIRSESDPRTYSWTQLLRVNRQINKEATDVLYKRFTFEFMEFPLEDIDLDIALTQVCAKQRQLISSVRLAIVLGPTLEISQLSILQRFSKLLPNLRSIEFLLLINKWTDEGFLIAPIVRWPDQVLMRLQCFPSAQTWKVYYCELPERPTPRSHSNYRHHIWYEWIPPEERIELEHKISQRNSSIRHAHEPLEPACGERP